MKRSTASWITPGFTAIDPNLQTIGGTRNNKYILIILATARQASDNIRRILSNRQHPAIVSWYEYDNLSDAHDMLCHYVRYDK